MHESIFLFDDDDDDDSERDPFEQQLLHQSPILASEGSPEKVPLTTKNQLEFEEDPVEKQWPISRNVISDITDRASYG